MQRRQQKMEIIVVLFEFIKFYEWKSSKYDHELQK
jgi:hypothetical protein